jgi:transposase
MRTGISITLKPADRRRLATLARDRNAPHKHVWRAEIVLLSADGVGTNEIMRRTGKSKTCVWRWQERFMQAGCDGLLHDKTRPSRIPPLGSDLVERVVMLTQTDPPTEATHWTAAMMAKAVGISASSVQRIWRAHGLQPHRIRQFKLSNDPKFIEKLRDVVGLYVDPPAHAIVLSVDEKSQIQALDRTQPGLPMKKGRAGTMTHDYAKGSEYQSHEGGASAAVSPSPSFGSRESLAERARFGGGAQDYLSVMWAEHIYPAG